MFESRKIVIESFIMPAFIESIFNVSNVKIERMSRIKVPSIGQMAARTLNLEKINRIILPGG